MKNTHFFDNFLEMVEDIYDAEKQIVAAIPNLVKQANDAKLKEALNDHLVETKEQVKRLEKVFKILGVVPREKVCKVVQVIISEGEKMVKKTSMSPSIRDCFIIISSQKIEHYEITAYGSLFALVRHLRKVFHEVKFEDVENLLFLSLKEEKKADSKLTSIAEGKIFLEGVNHAIEKELAVHR